MPIRRNVGGDFVACLERGAKGAMLRRHLKTAHNLTAEGYPESWNLSADYPLVAPNYAARRSELAKNFGLEKRSGSRPRRASAK